MKKEYNTFLKYLKESKEKTVLFVLDLLEKNKASLKDVYFNFLIPAMKEIRWDKENNKITKFEENLIESRLKTAIECTYSFVIKQKAKTLNKKVLIIVPTGEEEQVGALIASNIFELVGFKTTYIDSSINDKEILLSIKNYKPDYLTFGLKNFYNAFKTQKLINEILEKYKNIKIIVGGPVFKQQQVQNALTHHYFIKDYTEIYEIAKEVQNETSIENSN